MTVWLIRHGESLANAGSHTTGSATNPLTPRGEQQAALVAFDHPPDLVVHSPYLRARQTAQPTIDRFPSARVEEWPIEEFDYLGRFHGKPTTAAQRAAAVAAYWDAADPHYRDDENSESFVDVHARARQFLARLADTECSYVAAFTHGMFMRIVLWAILTGDAVPDRANMRRFHAFRMASLIPNCSILPLVLNGEQGYQFSAASTAHLPVGLRSGGH
ncbi:histidine phosphatase family protein [Kibdelosporangium aridum]|uniref:Histidine phosphatase family protein n=1 Tax=Kibdelosporangium aridum TaxID=2030 RepID=A0A428ZND9_KIBAR|nr:histidine phosphatase family protein [Kibdelosporangium aridum]RSM89561.1 histidine phosphatase family protein [Kibdelosporangium aridum]